MKNIILPNTELNVSQLGLGTASLHHLMSKHKRELLLTIALDSGFTHFDTAPLYGDGLAERTLGNFLGSERHKITIGTKVGLPAHPVLETFPFLMYAEKAIRSLSPKFFKNMMVSRQRSLERTSIEKSLQRSLKALQTDWVDVLFIHEPQIDELPQLLKIVEWLQRQKEQGVVRYLGLAGNSQACVELARKIPGVFEILQVEDSLYMQEADLVTSAGLPLQITFGYLRKALERSDKTNSLDVIKTALLRNSNGMILVSSRNSQRLKALASL